MGDISDKVKGALRLTATAMIAMYMIGCKTSADTKDAPQKYNDEIRRYSSPEEYPKYQGLVLWEMKF